LKKGFIHADIMHLSVPRFRTRRLRR
jgi:hypothetical protein